MIELVFVLDGSGSMWSLTKDTINNYNKLLEERRKEGNCIVSTIVFNDHRKVIHDRISIDKVKKSQQKIILPEERLRFMMQ